MKVVKRRTTRLRTLELCNGSDDGVELGLLGFFCRKDSSETGRTGPVRSESRKAGFFAGASVPLKRDP